MHDAGWGRSDLKLRAVCGYLVFFFFGVVICIELCFFLYVVGRKSDCKIQLLSDDLSSHLILESTPIGLSGQCLHAERTHEPHWASCEGGSWLGAGWIKGMVSPLGPGLGILNCITMFFFPLASLVTAAFILLYTTYTPGIL
ncbi:hypothetical protein VN97_g11866 [Penicillium thymicola]|uniref:Uncharacterized protein n=1 Tax=Penicillium thymicola TaxID=293382 RepID=A0AAI9X2Z4_PENTH|nr:hypothetical protein VN97_g11866 [Penicillium thymicola]